MSDSATNPAVTAAKVAQDQVNQCLRDGDSFLLEAGAGAGKTYSLIESLQFLLEDKKHDLLARHQRVACITFTNIAKDEIESRTDHDPLVFCETIHAYCWSLIRGFQDSLRGFVVEHPTWKDKLTEAGSIADKVIEYSLGHRSIRDNQISIHHDDVLEFTVRLMENTKFRRLISSKYPIILIDEYQDTSAKWIGSIKSHFLGAKNSPQFGFFGDHWQKIYGDGCGKIEHPQLKKIGKEANFRSVQLIVSCLNRMRPSLPQEVVDPKAKGELRVFHTNDWKGKRRTGNHWKGDLPDDAANGALNAVLTTLEDQGWDTTASSMKILLLTHRGLASKQGYESLPSVFRYSESFTKKENPYIAFFADTLEPAVEAYMQHKYGEMFKTIGGKMPPIHSHKEKLRWSKSMSKLVELRETGSVSDVIDHLRTSQLPRLPNAVVRRELEIEKFVEGDENVSQTTLDSRKLRATKYQEIISLCRYLRGHSPFETKHGVKGAEFENVLVVIGRGWNQYNFNQMFEFARDPSNVPSEKQAGFERNRNLFYVSCSRAKRRLAILLTQEMSLDAMQTLEHWFGSDFIEPLRF